MTSQCPRVGYPCLGDSSDLNFKAQAREMYPATQHCPLVPMLCNLNTLEKGIVPSLAGISLSPTSLGCPPPIPSGNGDPLWKISH